MTAVTRGLAGPNVALGQGFPSVIVLFPFLLLSGSKDEALEHFRWVEEYGNREFVECKLAVAELARMNKLNSPGQP